MSSTDLSLWENTPDVIETVTAEVLDVADDAAVSLAVLEARAEDYALGSKSANTWRAYRSDLRHFDSWCVGRGVSSMPASPTTVRNYLVDHAERLAVSTLRRRLAAISEAHELAGEENPTKAAEVRVVWAGMRREHGRAPRAKEAAVTDVITALVKPLSDTKLLDLRDRALLLIGFAGAMRRSELAALRVADIVLTADGLRVTVSRSKTDQEGAGAVVGLAYGSKRETCPVRAWRAWADAVQLVEGPAFRRVLNGRVLEAGVAGDGIARIIKRRAAAADLDPALFSGHSLRSGFATTAARAGVAEHKIMSQGRWTTSKAMRGYIREGELFTDNPSAELGL